MPETVSENDDESTKNVHVEKLSSTLELSRRLIRFTYEQLIIRNKRKIFTYKKNNHTMLPYEAKQSRSVK